MSYYNYHATAKKLIAQGKLQGYYFVEQHRSISPALVLIFDDFKHPIMPIREYRWEEYLPLLPKDKRIYRKEVRTEKNTKRGCCIKAAPKRKATAIYRKGIELSLAL